MVQIFEIGYLVTMKKPHPCGGSEWTVDRIGADIGIACNKCHRRLILPRSELEKRSKGIKNNE